MAVMADSFNKCISTVASGSRGQVVSSRAYTQKLLCVMLKIPAPVHMIGLNKFEVREIEMSRSPSFELFYHQTLDVNLKESLPFCF